MRVNTGLDDNQRRDVSVGIARLQADTFVLYLKTLSFHWNITGPMFQPLHRIFEEQYRELSEFVDALAERIRALGFPAPGTSAEFNRLTVIQEEPGLPGAEEMVRQLVDGRETVVRTIRSVFTIAQQAGDQATVDLVTQQLRHHEKTAWGLRSFLEQDAGGQRSVFFRQSA